MLQAHLKLRLPEAVCCHCLALPSQVIADFYALQPLTPGGLSVATPTALNNSPCSGSNAVQQGLPKPVQQQEQQTQQGQQQQQQQQQARQAQQQQQEQKGATGDMLRDQAVTIDLEAMELEEQQAAMAGTRGMAGATGAAAPAEAEDIQAAEWQSNEASTTACAAGDGQEAHAASGDDSGVLAAHQQQAAREWLAKHVGAAHERS